MGCTGSRGAVQRGGCKTAPRSRGSRLFRLNTSLRRPNMRNRLRQRFRDKTTAYGLWVTVESPSITEMAVVLGLDWVCIDMEHGHLGFQEVIEHLRAVAGSETSALVRVPGIE